MWLGFFAWYRGLALGGTVRVSQVQLVQPFLSLLFAVPVLGERLDATTVAFSPGGDRDRVPRQAHARRPCRKRHMNTASSFKLARRAAAMNPSVIREILKLTEKAAA